MTEQEAKKLVAQYRYAIKMAERALRDTEAHSLNPTARRNASLKYNKWLDVEIENAAKIISALTGGNEKAADCHAPRVLAIGATKQPKCNLGYTMTRCAVLNLGL